MSLCGIRISNHKAFTEIKRKNKNNDPVYADSAGPKSISELRQYGMCVLPVKKGPDSVDYGIKLLQDLGGEIVIDPEIAARTRGGSSSATSSTSTLAATSSRNSRTMTTTPSTTSGTR